MTHVPKNQTPNDTNCNNQDFIVETSLSSGKISDQSVEKSKDLSPTKDEIVDINQQVQMIETQINADIIGDQGKNIPSLTE